MESSNKIKKMLSKLRQPLGIDYISKNLLNVSEIDARDILDSLIDEGVIVKDGNEYMIKPTKK